MALAARQVREERKQLVDAAEKRAVAARKSAAATEAVAAECARDREAARVVWGTKPFDQKMR